jgi:methionine aminopeptidase
VVKTYCGHGIGDLFHCAPNIPHYAHNKAVGVMKEGMVGAGRASGRGLSGWLAG